MKKLKKLVKTGLYLFLLVVGLSILVEIVFGFFGLNTSMIISALTLLLGGFMAGVGFYMAKSIMK